MMCKKKGFQTHKLKQTNVSQFFSVSQSVSHSNSKMRRCEARCLRGPTITILFHFVELFQGPFSRGWGTFFNSPILDQILVGPKSKLAARPALLIRPCPNHLAQQICIFLSMLSDRNKIDWLFFLLNQIIKFRIKDAIGILIEWHCNEMYRNYCLPRAHQLIWQKKLFCLHFQFERGE